MIPKADFTVKEVTVPQNKWCRSGHIGSDLYRRDPNLDPEPTRYFQVTSDKDPKIDGVYCEPCLVVAHAAAKPK